jgi:hypothetical protein
VPGLESLRSRSSRLAEWALAAHADSGQAYPKMAYDGITVHPDIGSYGNIGNRECKQYASWRQHLVPSLAVSECYTYAVKG